MLLHFRPLREIQGSATPGAPAGVLVKSLNTLRPTPPSRQQWSCGLQELHHRSPGPVRNGPGNSDVNTLALLQREILVVTLKFWKGRLFSEKILDIYYGCPDSPGHSRPRRGPPPSPDCPPGWRTMAGRCRCPGRYSCCRSPPGRGRGRCRAGHWPPLSCRTLSTQSDDSLSQKGGGGGDTHGRSSNIGGPQRTSRRYPRLLRRSGAPPWRT